MATREEVVQSIRKVVYDCFPDMRDMTIEEDTVINTDAAIDSMGFVLIICKLEAMYDIRIPQRQWNKMQTMSDVADAIMKQLGKKA